MTIPLPGNGSAVLTLSRPVPPESVQQLERALTSIFGALPCEAPGAAANAGQIEYASWLAPAGSPRH